ncbi:BON domain-containing protein [Thalassospira lucentensis]|jgi:osmotically-inducible protein OsmY|uniref:BON domain-containing protein n=1 Tax=Thalassospira lucentensis TaxID=168935 RepID=A0A358HQX5_9PROT|nr:BON domain-containing protein [Thalassospira lucentensis]HBU97154.1 BON domain-containing protein [Thalassospira lucentensis]HCW67043.1 BON domain-containing protein [Thalassospira lucentensis]|tara:strand:- start:599 stop:1261 length:663 start_codon:yes stop_codon:yes gene_type:complete
MASAYDTARHFIGTWPSNAKRRFCILLTLAFTGFGILPLAGCTSMAIGAGATAGVAAFQERGFEGAVSDTAITAEIWQKFLAQDESLFLNIEIEVVEGEVLLAGEVKSATDELEAVKLTWQVGGVRSVLNEISVGEGASFMDNANDLLITTRIKTALMFDTDVFAINYSIETVKGTVHLMGIAQDDLERNRVIAHARDTSYVRRVVSHIRLKNDANRQGT